MHVGERLAQEAAAVEDDGPLLRQRRGDLAQCAGQREGGARPGDGDQVGLDEAGGDAA